MVDLEIECEDAEDLEIGEDAEGMEVERSHICESYGGRRCLQYKCVEVICADVKGV